MLLTIDIGNTQITLGAYDGKTLKFVSRMATDTGRSADQYAIEIHDILELYDSKITDYDAAIISSVVPSAGHTVKSAIERFSNIKPIMVGPGVKSGLNIKIDNPAQLGADLVAGAVAAISLYELPCLIIDLGTATTISVVDKNGDFLGTTISAGVGIARDALAARTAQLPYINVEAPPHIIGTNSIDSMKSGLVLGMAAMVDGLADRIEKELGMKATLVATGGRAKDIVGECRRDIIINENLLLEGLRLIYVKNRKEKE